MLVLAGWLLQATPQLDEGWEWGAPEWVLGRQVMQVKDLGAEFEADHAVMQQVLDMLVAFSNHKDVTVSKVSAEPLHLHRRVC